MTISVLTVNHNTDFLLERFVNHLKSLDSKSSVFELEIIILDAGSTDDSLNVLKKIPGITYIEYENKGLSAGYNKAAEKATGEFLLLLGTDAFPDEGCIEGIANYLKENSDVGVATAELYMESGELDMDAHRGFTTPLSALFRFSKLYKLFPNSKFINSYFMEYKDMTKPHEIDAGISHFFFIPRHIFDEVGGFDEDYFLYGEDIDFCYRVKAVGYKVMYLPQFRSLHLKGAGIGIRSHNRNQVKRPLKYRLRQRKNSIDAMQLFVEKHYRERYPLPLYWIMLLGMFLLRYLRYFVEILS